MLRVLSLRDFRLLFSGATTSLLGDQFALIATPWLVLQLTGDPLALGIVLALEGLPRAGRNTRNHRRNAGGARRLHLPCWRLGHPGEVYLWTDYQDIVAEARQAGQL
jgi:hypothetical protein